MTQSSITHLGARVNTYLISEVEGGPWTEAAVWPARGLPTDGLIFEIDEPVYIHGMSDQPDCKVEDRIFYIAEFREGVNGCKALVGSRRGAAALYIPMHALRKLDPLRRLAAEAIPNEEINIE